MRKTLSAFLYLAAFFALSLLLTDLLPQEQAAQAGDVPDIIAVALAEEPTNPYYRIETVTLADGTQLSRIAINGPPEPPPGYELERTPVTPPVGRTADAVSLDVPAYDWVFGCSAVSAAMIGGYFDRNGLPNIYTGPTNGGVMPMNNSVWPKWTDSVGKTYPSLPLAASRNTVDGRVTRGSIDNYWVAFGSALPDPYIINGWPQHAWGDAFGDYMKTSQSAYDHLDGYTFFYWNLDGTALTCERMESAAVAKYDGTYGLKLFYEARGYAVSDCYSQRTDNMNANGFTFAQYKAQIDAGNPVMISLLGHTMVGVGYKEPDIVYIHDTWDYETHQMTWGGSYSDMKMNVVSVVNPVRSAVDPSITSLSPSSATAGGPAFTLTVNGAHFVNGSIVRWNGGNRATTYVNASRLTATIPAADIISPGTFAVTVANPGTGGTSNTASFVVRARPTSFKAFMPAAIRREAAPPPPAGPAPGYWRHDVDNRMYFYVTPNRAFVDDFAIQVTIDGCGKFTITHLVLEKIVSMKFAFGGPFYASGTFSSDKKASGTAGLKDYDLRNWGCGFVTGGPWPWEACWRNSNQPAMFVSNGLDWAAPIHTMDDSGFSVR